MIFLGLTIPAFLFGSLLSLFLGALVHFWQGGNWKFLLLFITASWLGFWVGHFVATALGWRFLKIGPVNLGFGLIADLLLLGAVIWFVKGEKSNEKGIN